LIKPMELPGYLKSFLKKRPLYLRRRLGQNLMVDERILRRLVEYADLHDSDVVLEVGGGLGFLTALLAEAAGKVITVEKEPEFAAYLRERFGCNRRVEIMEGDFLRVELPSYNKVVSNPPYSRISKIVSKLLGREFDCGVLTLQREFAERMVANPTSRDYGVLSVKAYVKAEVELLESIPPSAFYPQPKVVSVITRIQPRREPSFKVKDWKLFEEVVSTLFTQRNKTVKNALKALAKKTPLPMRVDYLPRMPFIDRRVFTLTPEEFGVLADALHESLSRNRV